MKPSIYNSRTVGARGGASHFSFYMVGVWGEAPHIFMSGRGARSPAMLHTDYLALGAVAEGHIRVGNVLVALDVHFFSFAVSGDGELQRVAYAVSLDCFFDIGR